MLFNVTEWAKYKQAYDKIRAAYAGYEALGASHCNSHQLAIMALLSPLRRMCSGGFFKAEDLEVRDQ